MKLHKQIRTYTQQEPRKTMKGFQVGSGNLRFYFVQ